MHFVVIVNLEFDVGTFIERTHIWLSGKNIKGGKCKLDAFAVKLM